MRPILKSTPPSVTIGRCAEGRGRGSPDRSGDPDWEADPPLAAPRAASAPAKYLTVETDVELVLPERLLNDEADLVE